MDKQYQNVIFLQAGPGFQASGRYGGDTSHGRSLPVRLDWHDKPGEEPVQGPGQAALPGTQDGH